MVIGLLLVCPLAVWGVLPLDRLVTLPSGQTLVSARLMAMGTGAVRGPRVTLAFPDGTPLTISLPGASSACLWAGTPVHIAALDARIRATGETSMMPRLLVPEPELLRALGPRLTLRPPVPRTPLDRQLAAVGAQLRDQGWCPAHLLVTPLPPGSELR